MDTREDPDGHQDLTLKLSGYTKPGQELFRNVLFDQLYASMPKDPQVKVQIYNAEIAPGGYTNWHCHNGATFFVALQGIFEAEFQEGILIKAKAGDVYSEPIGEDASRPQSAPRSAVSLHRDLHHRARPRPRHQRRQQAVVSVNRRARIESTASSDGSPEAGLSASTRRSASIRSNAPESADRSQVGPSAAMPVISMRDRPSR